ncbi:MAG: ankyrin repeat domain-containing protein [Candidatus Babeliales bacterium]|jgi:ankyrin repeat protein
MMKKIFSYSNIWFFLLAGSSIFSSAPAQSSAIATQDAIQFKGLTGEQEERFLSALSGDDTTIISTFDSKVVEENEYAFTKAAVVVHNKSFFDYFLNRISPAKLQAKNEEQYSLLHVAAEVGNAHAVKNLIEKGLSVTDKTLTNGRNPLHAAYLFKLSEHEDFDPRVVQLLVSKDPKIVNELDGNGRTALHYAVLGNNTDMLLKLLSHRPNFNVKDKDDCTALDYAIINRNVVAAEGLLNHVEGNIYCKFHKNTILKLISGPQYDLNSKRRLKLKPQFSSEHLTRLLFHAAKKGSSASIIALLLENGANPNAADRNGRTPLYVAVLYGHTKMVRRLLDAKADLNAVTIYGFTPLHDAAEAGNIEILTILFAAHADPNAASVDGWTPLHRAAIRGCVETVKVLLDAGANPNAASKFGSTPLSLATNTIYPNPEIVKLLKSYMSCSSQCSCVVQ